MAFRRQLSDSAGTLCDWLRWISRKRTWQQYAEDYNNSGSTERYDLLDHLRGAWNIWRASCIAAVRLLLYRLFVVAQNAPDAYGMLMVSGVFVTYFHSGYSEPVRRSETDAGNGNTLPFISYGGTSVLFYPDGNRHCPVRLPLYCVPGWKERRRRGAGGRTVKSRKNLLTNAGITDTLFSKEILAAG